MPAVAAARTGSALVLSAPGAGGEPRTERAAAARARRLRARALVLGAPAEVALSSSHDAATEVLAAALGAPGAEAVFVEVRGGGFRSGAVLSWGGLAEAG